MKETPLRTFLIRSKELVELRGDVTYKQITVRLHHKGVVLREEKEGAQIGSTKQFKVKSGQLILSRIDARNGAIGIIPDELDGAIVTNDFWGFDLDRNQIDGKFLDYYVGTPLFVEKCRKASEGTTNRVRLQPERFLDITIPLPPLSDQQRIVAKIEELIARIEEAKRLRQEAKEEAGVVMSSATSEVFARAEKEDWTKRQLREICQIVMGQSPPGRTYNERNEGLPFYQGKADFGELYPAPRKWCNAPKKIAREKDILISVRAPVGPTNLCREDSCIGRGLAALRASNEIDFMLLLYFLRCKETAISKLGQGSTFRAIGKEQLGSIEISLPPKEDHRRIVDYLDKLQSRVDELRKYQTETQKQIDALSQSILAKAFRGEL